MIRRASEQQYDENMAEIERIDASITRHQKLLDLTVEERFKDAGGREHDVSGKGQQVIIFDKWARGGMSALSAEEAVAIRNTMSGNPNANPEQGGYIVPTAVAKSILELAQLRDDLEQAVDLCLWQRRPIVWFKSLLYTCQDQARAPTDKEIQQAMSYADLCEQLVA